MNWLQIFENTLSSILSPATLGYAIAALGLAMHFGYGGLINMGVAGFMALGAYGYAISVLTFGFPWWLAALVGLAAAAVFALILGIPTLRLRADYLAIATIAAGEIVRLLFTTQLFDEFTNSADGLAQWWANYLRADPTGDETRALSAAAGLLRERAPGLRVRVVNVVDLLTLAPRDRHARGMTDGEFTTLFGADVPVVFAFHGYPSAVHDVLHGRADPNRFRVHGYLEEGTTTTPYDLLVANAMSRHDLAAHAVSLAAGWSSRGGDLADDLLRERDQWVAHAYRTGADNPAFTDWTWTP